MATYIDVKRVQYLDASGVNAPLCRLYFCRYCLVLRASESVSHEVDSYFCPNCLETIPAPEARLKKNRCTNCFDCPSCCHTLSTRASSIAVQSQEDPTKTVPKKVYYLACAYCRWTSRDVGIPDQSVASGGWPIQENPYAKRISSLLEYYRQVALREKLDEKKRHSRRRNYMPLHFSDKYGMSAMTPRRRPHFRNMGDLSINDGDDLQVPDLPAGEVVEDFEELPDSVYTDPIILAKVTTIEQRHANPGCQPDHVSKLYPMYKQLLIKRSQRCKECEHNVCKPEFNPASIKFKIQLAALQHVPEIRIMQQANLQHQKETQAILTLCNPQDNVIHVTLSSATEHDKDWSTATLVPPKSQLVLPPRDDVAEFDDNEHVQDYKDDPSVIVFRKANKIGFLVKVTPQRSTGEVKVALRMRYDYRNMTTALQSEKKPPEMVWLEQVILINLGVVVQ